MKKGLSLLISATALLGLSQLASAAATSTDPDNNTQTLNGLDTNYSDNTADIEVNGVLGADNTDASPNNPIPDDGKNGEPNPQWINVTVPTKTVFFNTLQNSDIQAPNYEIKNNSGRPVSVSVNTFTHTSSDTLPADFDLDLELTTASTKNVTARTPLIASGALSTSFPNYLVTLANNEGKQTVSDTAVTDSNLATFTYGGKATVTTRQATDYTLNLKFVPVTTEFK